MFDGLRDSIVDDIIRIFGSYFTNIDDIFDLAKSAPSDAISGFPSVDLWSTSTSIANSIGLGIASSLIALFLLFELASMFNRSDTKGWDGLYWILMAFLKVAVMVTLCKNMTLIIDICFQIGAEVVNNIAQAGVFGNGSIEIPSWTEAIRESFGELDFIGACSTWLMVQLCSIINSGCLLLVRIICQLRFIEIYVFVAIAPLPFCTFISKEYRNIGIAYIKRMLALALQGALIALVCYLYLVIFNFAFQNYRFDGIGSFFYLLGFSVLLVIAVVQTGGWSKSLVQTH